MSEAVLEHGAVAEEAGRIYIKSSRILCLYCVRIIRIRRPLYVQEVDAARYAFYPDVEFIADEPSYQHRFEHGAVARIFTAFRVYRVTVPAFGLAAYESCPVVSVAHAALLIVTDTAVRTVEASFVSRYAIFTEWIVR